MMPQVYYLFDYFRMVLLSRFYQGGCQKVCYNIVLTLTDMLALNNDLHLLLSPTG